MLGAPLDFDLARFECSGSPLVLFLSPLGCSQLLRVDRLCSGMVAFLYGDGAAETMGFAPLGLGDHVGYDPATALASEAQTRR
jgi:hypothetical protein